MTNNNNNDNNNFNSKSVGIIIAFIVGIIVVAMAFSGGSSKNSSKWDKLSPSEKAWYERNYGNGKSKQYDDAIKSYKSTH